MINDTIYIIGAGAVGKVLAVSLKHDKKNVILLRGSIDDKSSYTEKIQVVLENKAELEEEIEISTLSNFSEFNGIIILANKSYGNENLSQALKGKTNNSPIVILQNGLGIEQPFISNDFPEIYRCVLFMTSQHTSPNRISYKPVSVSPIGIIKGDSATLDRVVKHINSPTFPFRAEIDIQPIVWKKAIINCVFNSICPLLEIDNGIFHHDERVLEIAKRVVEECIAISGASGILLTVNEVLDGLLLISKSSDGQLISTLQDINNKRETEIETLNFEIVRIGEKLKMEDKVKETKLLGELTKLKSDLTRQKLPAALHWSYTGEHI
jgi:2-dehydropantoate 2-reductase